MNLLCLSTIRSITLFLFFLIPIISVAQNPTGYIANWKNDAKGAYSIVHDDYGDSGVDGIWQYADTICFNRGVKFTIGAIASSCESSRNINGYSSPYAYAKEVMIAQHGHEIMSHSHTHSCALGNAGWSPCNMAVGWGEDTTSSAFDFQLVRPHNSILNGTGVAPQYYIFPYDRFTDRANRKLKSMGYVGSRTGWSSEMPGDIPYHRNGYNDNDEGDFFPDSGGFFRTAVQVFDDVNSNMSYAGQVATLNDEVDSAIANNEWANRELHNVTYSSWGWGRVRVDAYRAHIDYLKSKIASKELFVGTVSEIMTYQMQKLKFTPTINYDNADDIIHVTWNTINPQFDVDMTDYMKDLFFKSPITLVVDVDMSGSWLVAQDGKQITDFEQVGTKMYINVYPHEGEVQIYNLSSNMNFAPVVENTLKQQEKVLDFSPFKVYLQHIFEDETPDEDLKFTYSGNEGVTVSNYKGTMTISSINGWTGTDTITFSAEDAEGLLTSVDLIITVTDVFAGHTPFSGSPISVPGRVEAEDYDEGGEGVAFHEISSPWEPSPADNPYRPNDNPDVGLIPSGGYSIDYGVTGEWLEYTIDVEEEDWYNVTFRVAQLPDGWGAPVGEFRLYVDNKIWVEKTPMVFTSGWNDYEDVSQTGVLKLTKGLHILKVDIATQGSNLDYIDIVKSPLSTNDMFVYQEFSVFPNPTNGMIELNGTFENANFYNQLGELVFTSSSNKADVSGLSKGVYYIKFDDYPKLIKLVKLN